MLSRVLGVKIIGGDYHRKTEFIPRIALSPTEDDVNFFIPSQVSPVPSASGVLSHHQQGPRLIRQMCWCRSLGPGLLPWPAVCGPVPNDEQPPVKIRLPPDQTNIRTTNVVYLEVLADEVSGFDDCLISRSTNYLLLLLAPSSGGITPMSSIRQ